jgi:autotransporter strand-loop-strand O-heptosyltransferase
LSWLAWACRVPVVMISGFTHPVNEFATPWRVINWNACNSCWHDPAFRFDPAFLYCPRHAGSERAFECTGLITADQVIDAIARVPGFRQGKLLALNPVINDRRLTVRRRGPHAAPT